MIWLDKIEDLQYYHQPKGVSCYCDAVAYPSDMFLQGHIYTGNGSYTLKIYVYSADGLTQYEDATAYFDIYVGVVPTVLNHFFNARLKSFSPAMCAHECYILRAVVEQSGSMVVFNKFTERYCQNNCCDVARNITLDQVGFSPLVVSNGNDPAALALGNDVAVAEATPDIYIPAGNCGEQLIRLLSKFDCVDKFTGDFYGKPDTVLSGTASFEYRKITTLRGRIVRRPREIKREISFNCRLQSSESAAQYLLEGFEYLPPWKVFEIEGQLHANRIFVDDFGGVREYLYAGGTPFKQISKCFELFKLETALEDCTQRQIFGCGPDCKTNPNFDGSDVVFAIPMTYNGGAFFNSNKQLVANDYEGLLDYFRTRDGVTDVQDVDMEDMDCLAHKVFSITSSGQVDAYVYYDAALPGNRIAGATATDINDLCGMLPQICIKPVLGVFTVTVPVCDMPEHGTLIVEDIDTDVVVINGYHLWVKDAPETFGSVYNNEVTFSIKVVNETITADPEDEDAPVYVNEIIGIVSAQGRPTVMAMINNSNSALPANVTITIDSYGRITYYGPATAATEDEVIIELNNITYNI